MYLVLCKEQRTKYKVLVSKFLTHHQPTHPTIHHTNPHTPKLTAQDIRTMTGRVHQTGVGHRDRGCEGEILTRCDEADVRSAHSIERRKPFRSIVSEIAARK